MSTSNATHANSLPSSSSSASTNNHHHPPTRRPSAPGAGAGGGSGGGKSSSRTGGGGAATATATPACAACKYQRRKCNPDCSLAPYFPADHQRQFLNAHRLFGVSNIIKTLRGLDPSQRPPAMASIIFQSDARDRDPAGGCYRIILDLHRQIDRASAELDLVLHHLAICRAQAQAQQHQQNQQHQHPPDLHVDASTINLIDDVQAATAAAADVDPTAAGDGVSTFRPQEVHQEQGRVLQAQQHQEQQYLYYYFGYGGDDQTPNNNDNAAGGIAVNKDAHESSVEPPSPLLGGQYHRQHCVDVDDDDDVVIVKPAPVEALFDVVRQHQAFLLAGEEEEEDDIKDDTSPDLDYRNSSMRLEMEEDPTMEQVQENDHDLKTAASLFKLTNCELSGGV